MKLKKLFVLSLLIAAGIFLRTDSAFAAVKTWDGGGSDDNMATAENWDADTAPVSGDSVVLPQDVIFSGCTADVELNNDLNASSVTLAGLTVSGSKPSECNAFSLIISGNEIKSSGNITGLHATIAANVTATGNITITSAHLTGTLAVGSHTVTSSTGTYGSGAVTGSGTLVFGGEDGGGGGGGCGDGTSSSYPFSGDGSGFTGAIVIEANRSFTIGAATTALGKSASSVTVNGGYLVFSLNYNEDATLADVAIEFNGGHVSAYQESSSSGETCIQPSTNKTITISGTVDFTAATDIYYLGRVNINFSGPINGQQLLTIDEGLAGSVMFADGSTLKSALKVITIEGADDCGNASQAANPNTKVVMKVDCSAYQYWTANSPFETSGIVGGNGKMGFLKILSGGILAPGLSPGCLGSNDLTFVEGATFEAEVGGKTVCTEYDQQQVTGTVTLGNATLSVLPHNGYKLVAGSKFVVISNDGSDAVSGTFKDLAEGATFKLSDGAVLKISYVGGDGNDVELTVITASTPDTGFALLLNNPAAILAATTLSAGALLYLARRMKFAPRRLRR